jgi:hypothetical protein
MTTVSNLIILNSSLASPAVIFNDTNVGIYSLSNYLSFKVEINVLKILDDLEIVKTDKNTRPYAENGFTKITADTNNALAITRADNSTAQDKTTTLGVFNSAVPTYEFDEFYLSKLVYYLNTIRYNTNEQTVVSYNTGLNLAANAYYGSIYQPLNNRIYLIPYGQSDETDWHYIDSNGAVQSYSVALTGANDYAGGVYQPYTNKIYLAPYNKATETTWDYIDCSDNTTATYETPGLPIPFSDFYSGAAYSPELKRIYLSPYNINRTYWNYIDCQTKTLELYYVGNVSIFANAYRNAFYVPELSRIYFVPGSQGQLTNWHYVDCLTGNLVEYTAPPIIQGDFSKAVRVPSLPVPGTSNFLPGYVFIPYTPIMRRPALAGYWLLYMLVNGVFGYIQCPNNFNNDVGNSLGGAYSPELNRIYVAPSYMFTANTFYIQLGSVPSVVVYSNAVFSINTQTTYDAVYFATTQRIYFSPYAAGGASQSIIVYLNCLTGTFGSISIGYTLPAGACGKAIYVSNNDRVYFSSYGQAANGYWLYVDNTNTVGFYYGPSLNTTYETICHDPVNNTIYTFPYSNVLYIPVPMWPYFELTTNTLKYLTPHNEPVKGVAAGYNSGHFTPNNYIIYSPLAQVNQTQLHYVDVGGVVVRNYPTTTVSPALGFIGIVYSTTQQRAYYIPFATSNSTTWYYINSAGTLQSYTNNATIVPFGYSGGAYDPVNDRIYLAPFGQSTQSTWHYINCANNTVVGYTNAYPTNNVSSYRGIVYSPNNQRMYLIPGTYGTTTNPGTVSSTTNWYYITCSTNVVSFFTAAGSMSAWSGGAFSPNQNRIYLAPYQVSGSYKYINCANDTIVDYAVSTVSVSLPYQGAVYTSTLDRIYFVPYNDSAASGGDPTVWEYVDCTNGNLITYSGGSGAVYGYYGGVFDPNQNKIYFAPHTAALFSTWKGIDCSNGSILNYSNPLLNQNVPGYAGACYHTALSRVYYGPFNQSARTNWAYISANTAVQYSSTTDILPVNAYNGSCYAPVLNRIYLAPYAQAPQSTWHYIDCAGPSFVSYVHTASCVANAYFGAVFAPTLNRIYFVPYAQATNAIWHYVDLYSGNIVGYLHGATAVANAYASGVYSPTQNRIYFVPYAQSNQATWHYIDCDTERVIGYAHGLTLQANAFISGTYQPTLDRLYLAPYAQSNNSLWYYIKTSNVIKNSKSLASNTLFNKL